MRGGSFMRIVRTSYYIFFFIIGFILLTCIRINAEQSNIELANGLFKAGKFERAKKVYKEILAKKPKNFHIILKLGEISLFSNHLNEAEKWLKKAIELRPNERKPKSLLAEVYYRQNDFQKAASLFRNIGREVVAKKLESFKDLTPYQIESKTDITALNFIITDPLPVVQVRVNGREKVNFIIDTGGSELVLDSEFAKAIGAQKFGTETGTFAGGKKAPYEQGKIDSLILGDFLVKNVPIHIMNVRQFSKPIFKNLRMDGIIGTVLLYHFISTLNYPEGKLILARKTEENLKRLKKEAKEKKYIIIPFWMAGDHFMFAWGTINKSKPMLFLIDTGLAGGGFTCPKATIEEAGIKLLEDKAGEGIGGGGRVKVIPFIVEELSLGEAKEKNIRGLFVPGRGKKSPLEKIFGFHIGGIISHAFFRNYALTFDFTEMKLYLSRKK